MSIEADYIAGIFDHYPQAEQLVITREDDGTWSVCAKESDGYIDLPGDVFAEGDGDTLLNALANVCPSAVARERIAEAERFRDRITRWLT